MAKPQKQTTPSAAHPLPPAGATATPLPTAQVTKAPLTLQTPAPQAGPTHEQIARRAYEIFLGRGGLHGNAHEDWAQAERELRLSRY